MQLPFSGQKYVKYLVVVVVGQQQANVCRRGGRGMDECLLDGWGALCRLHGECGDREVSPDAAALPTIGQLTTRAVNNVSDFVGDNKFEVLGCLVVTKEEAIFEFGSHGW